MKRRLIALYGKILHNIRTSLRTQLILTFVGCLALAGIAGTATTIYLEDMFSTRYQDYRSGMEDLEWETENVAQTVEEYELRYADEEQRAGETQHLLNNAEWNTLSEWVNYRIIDETGAVLLKSTSAEETPVNLPDLLRTAMQHHADIKDAHEEQMTYFLSVQPVRYQDRAAYLFSEGVPSVREYDTQSQDFSLIGMIVFLGAFLILFYVITKRKTSYIEELARGLQVISQGELDHRVQQKGEDELGILAETINHMAQELQIKIEEEREAERAKNELITSVSHDLRTPLTSIIGYLRLLYDDRAKTPEEQRDYLRIAFGKSEQLQRLVEDLFDYTTLTHHDVRLNEQIVSLNQMVEQIAEEYVPLMEESGLSLHKELPADELFAAVDPEKWVRVFENLLSNAIKYSHKPGTVHLRLQEREGGALLVLENESDQISKEHLERLFERFYRLEASRSTKSGGSGLGLAIAKSIVELHSGKIWASSFGNRIQFQVWLPLAE